MLLLRERHFKPLVHFVADVGRMIQIGLCGASFTT